MDSLRCPECGALRINTSADHSVCPSGHGRLHPHIPERAYQEFFTSEQPLAIRITRRRFRLLGQQEELCLADRKVVHHADPPPELPVIVARWTGLKGDRSSARLFKPFRAAVPATQGDQYNGGHS